MKYPNGRIVFRRCLPFSSSESNFLLQLISVFSLSCRRKLQETSYSSGPFIFFRCRYFSYNLRLAYFSNFAFLSFKNPIVFVLRGRLKYFDEIRVEGIDLAILRS
jgi:hypothetical protein